MLALDNAVRMLLTFIGSHPVIGILVVLLAALSESIPIVGAVFPGTAVVIGASTLVGLGQLPLWPVLGAAALGAILSDGFAFAWGRRAGPRAFAIWPLSMHPAAVEGSQRFFERHGGKSIAIARFTPVVRAFVPLVAGASGMPAGRFYRSNVLSALAWSPAHVLPGALLGASLGALGHVSGRSLALLGIVAGAGLLIAWVMRAAWQFGLASTTRAQHGLLHRLDGRSGHAVAVVRALIDPARPTARQVALLVILLAVAVLAMVNLTDAVLDQGETHLADAAIANLVTSLRTNWSDRLLTGITTLADTPVTATVALIVAAWLWHLKQRRLAAAYGLLVAATTLLTWGLKATTHIPRPHPLYAGVVEFSFPSGHVTFVASLYGVLAWILAHELPRTWRRLAAGTMGLGIVIVAASRIYLGAHWPSDVTAGLLYGLGATAVFALAFHSLVLPARQRVSTALVATTALLVVGGWHLSRSYEEAVTRYAPLPPSPTLLTDEAWRGGAWRDLPPRRIDLGGDGETPLLLQWAGSPETLYMALARPGWSLAPKLGFASSGRFLSGATTMTDLPTIPQLHEGEGPVLTLVRPSRDDTRLVLRAWQSGASLSAGCPILLVAVESEVVRRPFGLLTLVTDGDAPKTAEILYPILPDATLVDGVAGQAILAASCQGHD